MSDMYSNEWINDPSTPSEAICKVYFNSACKSLMRKSVEQAGVQAIMSYTSPASSASNDCSMSHIRMLYSKILNCSPDCIAYAPSTSFAISIAAKNAVKQGRLSSGQKVLVLESDMSAAVMPWQYACSQSGSELIIVRDPLGSSKSWSDAIIEAITIDSEIAVISIPFVHWADGSIIDVMSIRLHIDSLFDKDHDRRPWLVIDGTQSIGVLDVDVKAIRPTIIACSVHKWLGCPHGLSLIYLDPSHHQNFDPLDIHERSRIGSDNSLKWDEEGVMAASIGGYPTEFRPGATRIDSGGRPSPIILSMVLEGLKALTEGSSHTDCVDIIKGIDQTISRLSSILFNYFDDESNPISEHIYIGKRLRSNHIIGLRFTSKLKALLAGYKSISDFAYDLWTKFGIKLCVRYGCLRLSLYVFNTEAEVRYFINAVEMLLREFLECSRKKRLLIIGGTSWLAQHVYFQLTRSKSTDVEDIDIYVTYRGKGGSVEPPSWIPKGRGLLIDLESQTLELDFLKALDNVRPDTILHLAAMTALLECEKNTDLALATNSPEGILKAVKSYCSQPGRPSPKYVFASTDIVYDGSRNEHSPKYSISEARPINSYGRSKLAFERAIESYSLPCSIVLRLSNMLGSIAPYTSSAVGKKFFQWLYENLKAKSQVKLRYDEYRSFVFVEDVVSVIKSILLSNIEELQTNIRSSSAQNNGCQGCHGVFNVGGPEGMSRLELAYILTKHLNIDLEVSSDDLKRIEGKIGHKELSESAHDNGTDTLLSEFFGEKIKRTSDKSNSKYISDELNQGGRDQWRVGLEGSKEIVSLAASPRCIIMDSSETERVFGVRFTSIAVAARAIIDVLSKELAL